MGSRLYLRLLSVALLVLFLPVAGIWSLADFERELLAAEERMMSIEARTLAAWLAESGAPDAERAKGALRRLARPLAGRIRIFAADGSLLADTAGAAAPVASKLTGSSVRDRPLYRIGALLWRLRRALGFDAMKTPPAEAGDERAIAAALAGDYGAVTRSSLDGSDTVLTVALPVLTGEARPAAGAVVVSRTTDIVLAALDRIRIDLFRVVLLSLLATFLIVLLLARGLVIPLLRLRDAAERAWRAPDEDSAPIPEVERRDEIGEVARALAGLRERLERRLGELEAFASDLAHEIRNPLATMRSAAELLPGSSSDDERRRLAELIRKEAVRVDRVVTSMQDLARLDAERSNAADASCDLARVAERVVDAARTTASGLELELRLPKSAWAAIPARAAERVVENLVENAVSFSPAGGRVLVAVEENGGDCDLSVADQGPGIPDEHRGRIFDRFFSWRPGEESGGHLGLGLAIARALVERHGGEIDLAPPPRGYGGACFSVRLRKEG